VGDCGTWVSRRRAVLHPSAKPVGRLGCRAWMYARLGSGLRSIANAYSSLQGGLDARVPKVVTFPEQRLAQVERQRVRQTIAEVQTSQVAAAFAEICVGLAGQAGLALGHRLDP
jgi:hypothetical protein